MDLVGLGEDLECTEVSGTMVEGCVCFVLISGTSWRLEPEMSRLAELKLEGFR